MIKFTVTSKFVESLDKLDDYTVKKIKKKLNFLRNVDNPLVFSKKLRGLNDFYRFRVGKYRIVFEYSNSEIILWLVKHRKDIYKRIDL